MIPSFTLTDIDECKREDKMGCSEVCVNAPGGFSCLYLSPEGIAQGRRCSRKQQSKHLPVGH